MGHIQRIKYNPPSIIVIEDALASIDIAVLDMIDVFVLRRTKRTPNNKELRLVNDMLADRPNGQFHKRSHPIEQRDWIGNLICPKECIPWLKLQNMPSEKQILFRKIIVRVTLNKGKSNVKLKKVRKR